MDQDQHRLSLVVVCKLYKKWKSVKRVQASREEAQDEILAYLKALEIPMEADEEKEPSA